MSPLINSMDEAFNQINHDPICVNLTTENICEICSDETRNKDIICIVENIADLWAIENTMIYKGQYHILGGTLSATEGRGPNEINIESLLEKIKNNKNIKEVIIATNPTIEGQTTAFYIADILKDFNLKITKPAYGIPLGSEFNYLDESTLDIAFKNKKEF